MMFTDYFSKVAEGIEFLIAFGSIIGVLGLIIGILLLLLGGSSWKSKSVKIILLSLILAWICGFYTGIKYFRIL